MSKTYNALRRATEEATRRPAVPLRHYRTPVELDEETRTIFERIVERLEASATGGRLQTLLVTAATSGEGTSTVARNLAAVIASTSWRPTLLVDGHLRSPSQHVTLRAEREIGLAEVASGHCRAEEAPQSHPDSKLRLLTAGAATTQAAALLSSPPLQQAFSWYRTSHDWVVIDAPPVLQYADTGYLARVCDAAVLVVQAEHTRWEVADEAKRSLERSGIPFVGGVLNRRKYHIPEFLYRLL